MKYRLYLLVFTLLAILPVSVPAAQDAPESVQVAEDAPLVYELSQKPGWTEIPHGKTVYVFEMNERVRCQNINVEFLREYRSSETWRYTIVYTLSDMSYVERAEVGIEEKQPGQKEWKKSKKTLSAGKSILLPGQEKAVSIDELAERAITAVKLPYISAVTRLDLADLLEELVEEGECKPYKGDMADGELILENKGKSKVENYSLRRIAKGGKEVYIAILGKKKKKAWVVPADSVPDVEQLLHKIFNPSVDDDDEDDDDEEDEDEDEDEDDGKD